MIEVVFKIHFCIWSSFCRHLSNCNKTKYKRCICSQNILKYDNLIISKAKKKEKLRDIFFTHIFFSSVPILFFFPFHFLIIFYQNTSECYLIDSVINQQDPLVLQKFPGILTSATWYLLFSAKMFMVPIVLTLYYSITNLRCAIITKKTNCRNFRLDSLQNRDKRQIERMFLMCRLWLAWKSSCIKLTSGKGYLEILECRVQI